MIRRAVTRSGVLLLVGVVVNVLVAWTLVAIPHQMSWRIEHFPTEGTIASAGMRTPPGWEPRTLVVRRGFGVRMRLLTEMEWMGSRLGMMMDSQNRSVNVCEAGWPMLSLRLDGVQSDRYAGASGWLARTWIGGLEAPLRLVGGGGGYGVYLWPDRLPVRPVPLGFVVNSVVYAALVFVMAPMPRRARRWWRGRRGKCRRCGYTLAGLESCPECGEARQGAGRVETATTGRAREKGRLEAGPSVRQ
ncbi:MAG: hypothetical protein R3B57_10985 [Phycisphaerales bacterium]